MSTNYMCDAFLCMFTVLQLLMETWGPMVAIGKLSTAPMQAGTMMGGSAQVNWFVDIMFQYQKD